MTRLVLSTGNVMSAGPAIIRRSGGSLRSNLEFVSSLRDNFAAARQDFAPRVNGSRKLDATPPVADVEAWTERDGKTLYIPRVSWPSAGLRDEVNQYEITVKFFFLPEAPVSEREEHVRTALSLVKKELGIQTIDLLVVSYPAVYFEGSCEWEADKKNALQGNLEDEIATWKIFEQLHQEGVAKRLGVAEFGSEKLGAFIDRTTVPPVVDQINLRDCCNVPPPLKKLAEREGVELNVHTDCTNILPGGTLRELLNHGPQGAGVLTDLVHDGNGLRGEVTPKWVVRYMAFVWDRGVIENKGYFAGAELLES